MGTIRPLDRSSDAELELVATRMRATLQEVLDDERGEAMYSLDWLRERVRFHLEPGREVFVLELDGAIVGHTIVREEPEGIGLFSTTWVAPEVRRQGLATGLLEAGEGWMRQRGLRAAQTCTATDNSGLRRLYEGRGYGVVEEADQMVKLERPL